MEPKKRMTLKPIRPTVGMDANRANEVWQLLRKAIKEIHGHNASLLSFEELYRNSYNLVLHKYGDMLYNGVIEAVTEHLTTNADAVIKATDEQLLSKVHDAWIDHTMTMTMIRDILMYMDRTYVAQKRKMPIYDMGLCVFRETIARHELVKDRLRDIILSYIYKERMGELIDRSLIRNVLNMLVELGIRSNTVYENDFESYFLDSTFQFYHAEAQSLLDRCTCSEYLIKVEQRLFEENDRIAQYLNHSTSVRLKLIVETELIKNNANTLIEMEQSGCISMFRHDKLQDVERMYVLFKRIPSTIEDIGQSVCSFIKTQGLSILSTYQKQSDKSAIECIDAFLQLHTKFQTFLKQSFHDDKHLYKCIQMGFESCLNVDNQCAQYLSQYIDDLLKSKAKVQEQYFETQLDQVLTLFRYLTDKDLFEAYYKKSLAKRLLQNKSCSNEAERLVIGKLKAECGYQFTSKLEGMFKDMTISKDLMEQFYVNSEDNLNTIQVQVLTSGFWPSSTYQFNNVGGNDLYNGSNATANTNTLDKGSKLCQLPAQVLDWCQLYEKFYFTKHNGRRLHWLFNMGTADLKMSLIKSSNNAKQVKKHELNVSTYQMCILMLFNTSDQLSYNEIAMTTQIEQNELKRHLISLCTPKARILLKSSKGKSIDTENDTFQMNFNFESKLYRVKVPLVSQKENSLNIGDKTNSSNRNMDLPGEQHYNGIPKSVAEDRKHLIEASIVRIMKTRKSMQHNNLIAEVTRQLSHRFVPAPLLIKRRIESLIERDYLERHELDRKTYNYLA